jgi:hypothetical protein
MKEGGAYHGHSVGTRRLNSSNQLSVTCIRMHMGATYHFMTLGCA